MKFSDKIIYQRNFNVAKPISANIIAIIQNRITIVDSAHPFFQNGDGLAPS